MPAPYTPQSSYHTSIQVPVDGDPGAEATFRAPFQALADNTAWLRDQRTGVSDQWRLNQIVEAYLNPQQRWLSGISSEAFGSYIGFNGTYFAAGFSDKPRVNYSFDGITWSQFALSTSDGQQAFALDYSTEADGARLFVGTDAGTTQVYSVSGKPIAPTLLNAGSFVPPAGAAAWFYYRMVGTTRIVAVTLSSSADDAHVFTSDNGLSWTSRGTMRLSSYTQQLTAFICGVNDRGKPILVVGAGDATTNPGMKLFVSGDIDALAWTPVAVDNSIAQVTQLYYTGLPGLRFVAVAATLIPPSTFEMSLWVSDDAMSWRRAKTLTDFNGVIPTPYGILVPDGPQTWFTRDAVNWIALPPKPSSLRGDGALVDAGNGQSILLLTGEVSVNYATFSGPRYAPLLLV